MATDQRTMVINRAGAEWDSTRFIQGITGRESYIADALREAKLSGHTTAVANALSIKQSTGERALIINRAKIEFDANPDLARITNREAFANLALRDAGLSIEMN